MTDPAARVVRVDPVVGFEPLGPGRTLVVDWPAIGAERARVLVVPGFGDEMNQMRRMVTLAAQALARVGVACRVFDLHGTGDSSADFSEATTQRWVDDCDAMIARFMHGGPGFVLASRLGMPLALAAAARRPGAIAGLVGWAPLAGGQVQLSALLRAAAVTRGRGADGSSDEDPVATWARDGVACLAGYPVSARMAAGLRDLQLPDVPDVPRIATIDVRLAEGGEGVQPTAVWTRRAADWCARGVEARALAVAGAPFWNVADLVDVPALVGSTVETIGGWLA
jgi:exosortase A-associated hydrolase 2